MPFRKPSGRNVGLFKFPFLYFYSSFYVIVIMIEETPGYPIDEIDDR